MGFTTGLLGGAALTSGILYLTVHAHRRSRYAQALALRQQSLVLNHIVEPDPPAAAPVPREVDAGLSERVKDGWNRTVEDGVRWVQTADWTAARLRAEAVLGRAWDAAVNSVEKK